MEENKSQIEQINEYFQDELYLDDDQIEETETADTAFDFKNYRKNIVTAVAFLIGVPDEKFSAENRFDEDDYERLKQDEDALVIRNLCILRTQFIRSYKPIMDERKFNMRSIEDMPEYIDAEAIRFLRRKGIEINIANAENPSVNIAYINQYVLDNITKVKRLIPEWVKFEYVKSLFLMPGCYAGHNGANLKGNSNKLFGAIFSTTASYRMQKHLYPYQMYITWPFKLKEKNGNILFNDLKFLRMLYDALGDKFRASSYVIDAKAEVKEEIYNFLDEGLNVAVFVDCENVDPYAFGATILNLDSALINKIKKIVLYDDINTSTAWDYITKIMDIPVEKVNIERVLENKSYLDIQMTAGVSKQFYQNGIESIILASSDSDFIGLIKTFPDARFLVLNEYRKTSREYIDALDKHNIQHCYMNEFAQDRIQEFKMDVLYLGLLEKINHFNETGVFAQLDVNALLQELFYDACIGGADSQVQKEKDAFYNKYLKKGLLIKPVTQNGVIRFKIEISK